MPRDKDIARRTRKLRPKQRAPRRDFSKSRGMKTRDPYEADTADVAKDGDMKVKNGSLDFSLIEATTSQKATNRRSAMTKKREASFSNNVAEFTPGEKVIQIYPVARPLVGIVTGSSRVEGKVYVSWNGRVMQHDPEEIQLASCTPFFTISRGKVASADTQRFRRYVESVRQANNEGEETAECLGRFLSANGFAPEEAAEMANVHFAPRTRGASLLIARQLTSGENVVILADGGHRPGIVGLFVGYDHEGHAIVDVSTSWTSRRDGSRLVHIPACALVPVESPAHTACCGENSEVAQAAPTALATECSLLAKCAAVQLTLDSFAKSAIRYATENGEAWSVVETRVSGSDSVDVSVASFGRVGQDVRPLVRQGAETKPGDEIAQTIKVPVGKDFIDVKNAVQRVAALVENANAQVMQFAREFLLADHVERDQKRFMKQQGLPQAVK